jgi:hypothetical protein
MPFSLKTMKSRKTKNITNEERVLQIMKEDLRLQTSTLSHRMF